MSDDLPNSRDAIVDILVSGKAADSGVESTVSLVRDGDAVVIIDPGTVSDRRKILDPLEALGVAPEDVTDVVLSHHHPDHTLNAALFPNARVHDHWAIYKADQWTSRDAEGTSVSPSVLLIATPGHTPQDITTVVGTADGIVAFTHAWWSASGPAEDPYADMEVLHSSRARVLRIADRIVPGHGDPFTPGDGTPH